MNFRPLRNQVVIRRVDSDQRSPGGIIIPDSAQEKPSEGIVEAVGPGERDKAGELIPLGVAVGDRVLFGKWTGSEIKLEGKDLLIMKETDILGVIA